MDTIQQFSSKAFSPAWKLDETLKRSGKSLVVRHVLRADGLETDFEYFLYDPRDGKVSFGYIVSGEFHEAYFTFKLNTSVVKTKWQSCWNIAKWRNDTFSTLLPVVREVFDNEGRS